MCMNTKLRLSGVVRESIVDGPGIRYTVFAQGCPHDCPGCHNPQTHDPSGGYVSSPGKLLNEMAGNPLLSGATLSGGEPFMQAEALASFAKGVHEMGLTVITYSGYTIEELLHGLGQNHGWRDLLEQSDLLIDGRYIQAEKDLTLRFRGSRNQRVINPAASLREGRAVETEFDALSK